MPRPRPILLAVEMPWLAPEFDELVGVNFGVSELAMVASVGVEATALDDEGNDDEPLAKLYEIGKGSLVYLFDTPNTTLVILLP
jgi:hypothetical protein